MRLPGMWVLLVSLAASPAKAEVSEVTTGYQNGLTYLPLMVMQEQKLVEKRAAAAGLAGLTAAWRVLSGPAPINDGLLAGNLQFGAVGAPSVVLLWAKTKKGLGIRAAGALASMPMYLNTNNPAVKTVKDFTSKDKIAVPSVKIGVQAVTLQMAAAQAFGDAHFDQLDALTVGMGHPEAFIALLSGRSEVTTHFSSPPYQTEEIDQGHGRVHTVLKSYDVLGGKATFTAVVASERFRAANPQVYAVYVAALAEASAFINHNRHAAAELYVRVSHAKETPGAIQTLLEDPDNVFDLTPVLLGKYAAFMYQNRTIKEPAASWRDLTHPNLHSREGS